VCPYKKKFGHRYREETIVKTQREDSHLPAEERDRKEPNLPTP
jgi:hypothetical protein